MERIEQTRQLAYKYGVALHLKNIPESWYLNKRAGKIWMDSFLKQHPPLSLKTRKG